MKNREHIAVIGAGAFGTCMANALSNAGNELILWTRNEDVITSIKNHNENRIYLPNAKLAKFSVTSNMDEALNKADIIVFAIPCQYIRGVIENIDAPQLDNKLVVNLAKGIEIKTQKTTSEIFSDVLGTKILERYSTISGPTFAKEIYQKMPSAACIAGIDRNTTIRVRNALSQKWFRLYSVDDLKGVELGGALKNIIAIAVGISDGLGFGQNSRAGLMTRSLHEMMKLGTAMGAMPQTFSGLSGIGDLMLTCMGDLSRNRQTGIRLGRGESIEEIMHSTPHVAEGVTTAKAVYEISSRIGLDIPNMEHTYKVLYEGLSPRDAVEILLSRDLRDEF